MGYDVEQIRAARRRVYDKGKLPRRDGTMLEIVPHTPHPEDSDKLRDIVAACKPMRTLEIGCATGLSTLSIFEALAAEKIETRHTAIDPYFSDYWGGAAELLMKDAGIFHDIYIDERESVVALSEMLDEEVVTDFSFIDGSHWFECVLTDLALISRIVKPDGTVVVDDPWMPAVSDAINYVVDNMNYQLVDTYSRNGKPRLVELQVKPIDKARAWDKYVVRR